MKLLWIFAGITLSAITAQIVQTNTSLIPALAVVETVIPVSRDLSPGATFAVVSNCKLMQIHANGLLLRNGVDYKLVGNFLTTLNGAAAGDWYDIVCFQ